MESQTIRAKQLSSAGRYKEALEVLTRSESRRDGTPVQLLRAELLSLIGESEQALSIVERIESLKSVGEGNKSYLHFIKSRISLEQGQVDAETHYLQKSILYAERDGDLERTCWAQLRLMAVAADRSGPEAVETMLPTLRRNVTRLGDPSITACLHVIIAELNAKRGNVSNALQHIRIAQKLLATNPHLHLEAWCEITLLGISIIQSDFKQALLYGESALVKSIDCGSIWSTRACLGNLALIRYSVGDFEGALEQFDRAMGLAKFDNEQMLVGYENKARLYLVTNNLAECKRWIGKIDAAPPQLNRTGSYVDRNSQLLKAQLLGRLGRWDESLACTARVIELAQQAGDQFLAVTANLFASEVYWHINRLAESQAYISEVAPSVGIHQPDVAANYERAVACLLAATGNIASGRQHRDRAKRILDDLRNNPAGIELTRAWEEAEQHGRNAVAPSCPHYATHSLVQNIAALMMHAGRPELLATSLVAILEDSNSATGAVAVSRGDSGDEETLASFGTVAVGEETRSLALGTARGRAVEVRVTPLADIESQATINAVTMLLGTVRDLERAHAEREERLTLWPIEEMPFDDDDSVISGRMRELMTFARKVARTNVTVLITGESGTGKEVLARAIHGFSARAKKPFVPFNCTAIPRELLESQLFGYKRGAFTGADRDHAGLIRSAKDGTLFLDEIGELGLDLQPKLLRFLESGEINPLGETGPFNIDVRIVAATNANLERLVEQGRFREDLYYRLNVICLSIPPLRERRDEIPALVHHFVARAGAEFGKGRVRVAEEVMERLLLYSWPGNIRQLQNELRRMVALADVDATLTPGALSKSIRQETARALASGHGPELAVPLTEKLTPTITRIEREMIKVALRANHGRVDAAAKALGISRKGLYLKRQRLGV